MWELIVFIAVIALLIYSLTDKGQMKDKGGSNNSSSSSKSESNE